MEVRRRLINELTNERNRLLAYKQQELNKLKNADGQQIKRTIVVTSSTTPKPELNESQALVKETYGIYSDSESESDTEDKSTETVSTRVIVEHINPSKQIKETIRKHEKRIQEIDDEISSINAGERDSEFERKNQEYQVQNRTNHKQMLLRKTEIAQKKREKRHDEREEWDKQRKEYVSKYEMDKSLAWYNKINNEILKDWQREKLKELPGNKGYVVQGCVFYGLQPPEMERNEKGEYVVRQREFFENKRVHVWNDQTYRVFNIQQDKSRVLVSRTVRRRKVLS